MPLCQILNMSISFTHSIVLIFFLSTNKVTHLEKKKFKSQEKEDAGERQTHNYARRKQWKK